MTGTDSQQGREGRNGVGIEERRRKDRGNLKERKNTAQRFLSYLQFLPAGKPPVYNSRFSSFSSYS